MSIEQLIMLADKLTAVIVLLVIVTLFVTGKIISKSNLNEIIKCTLDDILSRTKKIVLKVNNNDDDDA